MDLVARLPPAGAGRNAARSHLLDGAGGKGANQAVAAARLGARTAMIGCVGDDAFGRQLRDGLMADQVDCRGLRTASVCLRAWR